MQGGRPGQDPRGEAHRIWMTLAIIPTAGVLVALVSAIVIGSTGWWVLVGVLLLTATFSNLQLVARREGAPLAPLIAQRPGNDGRNVMSNGLTSDAR